MTGCMILAGAYAVGVIATAQALRWAAPGRRHLAALAWPLWLPPVATAYLLLAAGRARRVRRRGSAMSGRR